MEDRRRGCHGGSGFDLSVADLRGVLGVRLSVEGHEWTASDPASPLCRVKTDRNTWYAPILELETARVEVRNKANDWVDVVVHTLLRETRTAVTIELRAYHGAPVIRQRVTLRNNDDKTIRVTGIDTAAYYLALSRKAVVSGFTSAWGQEFEPFQDELAEFYVVKTLTGRSSHGRHPYVGYGPSPADEVFVFAPMWSGNWACRAERIADNTVLASAGLAEDDFWYDIEPGRTFEGPDVALSVEPSGASLLRPSSLGAVGRKHWYPPRPARAALPTEWNHWWPYRDTQISEAVFNANVDIAADLGFEVCTLDAGWFGPSDSASEWMDWRGDWHIVNRARFPNGLEVLGQHCREKGVGFGIWCEIEGLGRLATLGDKRDLLQAVRRGEPLGYVCFGCPEARPWAIEIVETLAARTNCCWIKFDFNVDPGLGCDRTDHGHGGGSGLYEHVRGYYAFLDEVRTRLPDVVLENCASGGLRVDLGILSHLHVTYLSDPDWLDHSLQVFWGAASMVEPRECLEFSNSEWSAPHRALNAHQLYDPSDPAIPLAETDTYLRAAMLHNFAISQRLPELPPGVAGRFREHNKIYREVVRTFVESGRLWRLTPQPLRTGGERMPAFQLSLEDADRHLVFVFRLDGEAKERRTCPAGLKPAQWYRVYSPFPEEFEETILRGLELSMQGIDVGALRPRHSLMLLVEPVWPQPTA